MARPGHAQLEYRLTAGSSAGISNTSESRPGAAAAEQTDFLLIARAGAQVDYTSRLTHSQAAYLFAATWWVRGTQSNSLSHMLNLSSVIQSSAATQVTLGASATLSQLSLGDTVATANPQTFGAIPAGTQEFAAVDANEAFTWQVNSAWRLDQMLDGRLYRPIGDNPGTAQNESLVLALGIARTWLRDQAGLRTRVGVIEIGEAAPAGAPVIPGYKGEFAEALLSWRRDWTPTWTSELGAGAFVLHVPGSNVGPTPAGSATVSYRNTGQELELRVARTVDPNVYVGAALERDLVSLRAALPIGRWQAFHLDAMADLEHDSGAGTLGGPTTTADIFFLQAGASYQPGNMFMYRLQYMFRDQFSASVAPGTSPFAAFRQQTAMFTIEVHYPTGVQLAEPFPIRLRI
jgi:hypothetical protein